MSSERQETTYTLEQARRLSRIVRHRIPGKGPYCPSCDVRVPQLEGLEPELERRLRECARRGEIEEAAKEIERLTGIGPAWARIMAKHERDLRSWRCDVRPISLDEVRRLTIQDIWDLRRGKVCRECGNAMPEIVLPLDVEREIRTRKGYPLSAMIVLRRLGVDAAVAKNYAMHLEPHAKRPTAPCPRCGADLASPRAKQCLECHADWH